jgi:integrase
MPSLRIPHDDGVSHLLVPRTRVPGKPARYYADFRDYADVGGAVQALTPPGASRATTDPERAVALATARLKELQDLRTLDYSGCPAERRLAQFAVRHLKDKRILDEADTQWLETSQLHLEVACDFFGANKDVAAIRVENITEFVAHLKTLSNGRGSTLKASSINKYRNSLSNMFGRAEALRMGRNPVEALTGRPSSDAEETPFLEVPEMAEILRFAREDYIPAREDLAIRFLFVLLATWALTGCRETEILSLELRDINLDRRTIKIRPNGWRRLKTKGSKRVLTINTQLFEILSAYLTGEHRPKGALAFPVWIDEKEQMVTDVRKALDKMPMPERLRRDRTPAEMKRAEEERQNKIRRSPPSAPARSRRRALRSSRSPSRPRSSPGSAPRCCATPTVRRGCRTSTARSRSRCIPSRRSWGTRTSRWCRGSTPTWGSSATGARR